MRSAIRKCTVLPVAGVSIDPLPRNIESIELNHLKRTLGWRKPVGLFGYSKNGYYKDLYVYFDRADKKSKKNVIADTAFRMYGLGGVQVYGRPSFKPIRGNVIVVALAPDKNYPPPQPFQFSPYLSVDDVYETLVYFRDSNVAAWQIALTRDAQRVNRARGNTSNIWGNTSNVYKSASGNVVVGGGIINGCGIENSSNASNTSEVSIEEVDVESEKEESDVKKERPAIKAVLLIGCWKSHSVSHEKFEFMKNQRLYKPPIPNACGVPLLLFKKSVGSNSNQPTTMLMCDTKTGFAPPEWQANVGECIAFRADGKDYTSTDQGIVHDYIMHLMDEFAEERVGNQVSAYVVFEREARE